MSDYLDLYDYRCRVAAIYRERNRAILAGEDNELVLRGFRAARDELFANHPQSSLDEEQRKTFKGLRYCPYNPTLRFVVDIDTHVEPTRQVIAMNANELMSMITAGRVHFTVEQEAVALSVYWLDVYGGGLLLPFRDTTCPDKSYGGGRYLFDTIKGNDFLPVPGVNGWKRIMLDFNYAYNPSCAYNDAWICPLAPVENRLHVPIRAGELKYRDW